MAIKNTKLGGVDFSTPSDRIKPTDLNDTFGSITTSFDITAVNLIRIAQNTSTALVNGIATLTVDTSTATTAYKIGTTYKPGGTIFDDYEDNSFDLAKHAVTGTGSQTITETGGTATITYSGTGTVTTTVRFIKDMSATGKTGIFRFNGSIIANDGGNHTSSGNNQTLNITYGNVTLYSLTSGTTEASITTSGDFYFILNSARTSCDVYLDGTLQGTIDISAAADGFFRIYSYANAADGRGLSVQVILNVSKYIVQGMSSYTDTISFSDNTALASSNLLFLYDLQDTTTGSTTKTFEVSFNNGSAYVTATNQAFTKVSTTNTNLKMRLKYTITSPDDSFTYTKTGCMYR